MKKIFLIIACVAVTLSSCKIDNYDGPDASIHGSILDEKTGELVGTDIQNGSSIIVREHGFTNPSDQYWSIKNTGEYRNDMIFSATYDVRFENANFYPFSINDFKVKSGDNSYDFKVTPYIRIKNPSIKFDGTNIVAKFSIEAGKDEVKVKELQLFAFSDQWVGNSVKYTLTGGTDKIVFNPSASIDSSVVYTLTINVPANTNKLGYDKNYYFRIGALGDVPNVGTVRFNYSPLEVISL